jgi:hypothetical protein
MSLEHSPARQRRNNIAARAASTIPEFCEAHRISRTKLYDLWAAGKGPRKMRAGDGLSSKVIITLEAAADWRREREAATEQKVT